MKMWYLCVKSFLEVHNLTTAYQKAFLLRSKVPCRTAFHFMASDPRVLTGGGARGQNLVHLEIVVFLHYGVHFKIISNQKAFILAP